MTGLTVTVLLLCFEHFGLNAGPCAYEASALLMNSSIRLLFVFPFCPYLEKKPFLFGRIPGKGGPQHTYLRHAAPVPLADVWRPY